MKKNIYNLIASLILMTCLTTNTANAQCMDWLNPTPPGGWNDFNTAFGGAPCDDGTGCPFNEITAFQVYAAEAYAINNFMAGGEYAFSICNGVGGNNWVADFTIIAPSGAVDAFGAGDGDGCTITWTASESGTYLIVINEEGQCGGGTNTSTNNGYPALTCISGAPCEPVVTTCNAGTLTTTGTVSICDAAGTFDLTTEMDTVPTGGGFGWFFSPQLGGTGGLSGEFIVTNADTAVTYNSDLNGLLSGAPNPYPVLSGPWVMKGATYSDTSDPFNSICSTTSDSLIVYFGTESPTIDDIQDIGNASAMVTVSGGVPPYTYLWSDPEAQTTETAEDLDPGTYSVTVTDSNGCTATDMVDITSTSVDNIKSITALQISPNPTSGNFSIQLELNTIEEIRINVMDISGKPIFSNAETSIGNNFEFDLSDKPVGIYIIKIMVGDQFLSRKLVLTR